MKKNKFLYYNTLFMCETDGKEVWTDKDRSKGFVPKDRAAIYYKIRGKIVSRRQVLNNRFLVPIKEQECPF
jgi:hypothetical protein